MSSRSLMLLAWCGPASIVLVLIGWMVLAGFLPPPSPHLSVDAVARLWHEHTTAKRLGLILCVWGGTLYVPFTISVMLALREAGGAARPLTIAQAALGTFGTVFFTLNFFILAMVAFRPDRPSEITQAMHDLGFSMTFAPVAPFTFQYLLIAFAIFGDRSPQPAFPRWVAYVNVWVGLLLVPATFIPFFKTGPMAWNGVLAFWIPVAVFTGWFVVMFWGLRRNFATSAI